eukprot:TRINITY_DN16991_c0_g1_i1.p1 TRINITY_DN16991_c0_g1~~TRINITY_DN16991_c0_g1_i1.p1  ORF type:complete len:452 (+),score=103.49 TRINITY_DN16991_c0_g1_i1:355-1710(+)
MGCGHSASADNNQADESPPAASSSAAPADAAGEGDGPPLAPGGEGEQEQREGDNQANSVSSPSHPAQQPPAPRMQNTQTVRSLVNLKKHTLKLAPDPESGSGVAKYCLSFVTDSTVPCRVLIYIMAYEKDDGKTDAPPRLKSKLSKREPSVTFTVNGLEQACATPAGQGVPLGSFEEEQLTAKNFTSSLVFPLVIRLQALSQGDAGSSAAEKDGSEASGLSDKTASSTSSPLQAQTTFATLVKQPDGSFSVQVMKQVLWGGGTSYVLHEIYGIDRSSEEDVGSVSTREANKECVICLTETRDTLALPCRHLCLCSDCAKALRNQSNKCPICRTVVQSLLQIKLANGAVPQAREVSPFSIQNPPSLAAMVENAGDVDTAAGGERVPDAAPGHPPVSTAAGETSDEESSSNRAGRVGHSNFSGAMLVEETKSTGRNPTSEERGGKGRESTPSG